MREKVTRVDLCRTQNFGQVRGLPGTQYRKGYDARERVLALLQPPIADAIRTRAASNTESAEGSEISSTHGHPSVIMALLDELEKQGLDVSEKGAEATALTLANEATFLMFAGAALHARHSSF